ncbi:MAG TPA: cell division protein FtsL [Nevskiaceae bacterium]|nr:cell division protein FtsL [Nevskiaceae bacterium]
MSRVRRPLKAMRGSLLLPLGLGMAVLVSALLVVSVKHQNRGLTTELDQVRLEREKLEQEWAQLQLEEAALAHHGRVERLAREQLNMAEPREYEIVREPAAGGPR